MSTDFYDKLSEIVKGGTIVEVRAWTETEARFIGFGPDECRGSLALVVETKEYGRITLLATRDAEGNGAGWLEYMPTDYRSKEAR